MKYRKKPVVVDAIPVSEIMHAAREDLPGWVREAISAGAVMPTATTGNGYVISTLEGTMLARREDMLIRGVKGELYPCKPDIFAATYEPAADLRPSPAKVRGSDGQ